MQAGAATLAYVLQFASNHYTLRTGASFTLAKAQFDRARAAMIVEATPSIKPTLSVHSVPPIASTALGGGATESVVQSHLTHTAGETLPNLVPFRAVSPIYTPTAVSP